MEGRLEHFHVRCRVHEDDALRYQLEARLRRIARDDLASAWEQSLERVFGADPTVYVFRTFTTTLVLRSNHDSLDSQIATDWAAKLTKSIVQQIVRGENDQFKTFTNRASFVAHFLDALLHGRAWQVWYFYHFAHLRSLDTPSAAYELLMDERVLLPQILVELAEFGTLDVLLARLHSDQSRELWRYGLDSMRVGIPEAARALLLQLMTLIDSLNLWAVSRPAVDECLSLFLAQSSLTFDWRDQHSLAMTMNAMFQVLLAHSDLRPMSRDEITTLEAPLTEALRFLDYLDTDYLKSAILSGLAAFDADGMLLTSLDEVSFPPILPIPERQHLLIDDLVELLRERPSLLDGSVSDSTALLRLYTALVARTLRWAGDPLVGGFLERLLQTRALIQRGILTPAVLAQLYKGSLPGALHLIVDHQRATSMPELNFIASLGDHAPALMELFGESHTASVNEPNSIKTECAGIFLLLRALHDLRLYSLVEKYAFLPEATPSHWSALLLALGLNWAGEDALRQDAIDQGLVLFAGIDISATPLPTISSHRVLWMNAADPDLLNFWSAVVHVLVGQRLVSDEVPQMYRLPIYGGGDHSSAQALIGEDTTTGVLVLGQAISEDDLPDFDLTDRSLSEATEQTFLALMTGDIGHPQADVTLRLTSAALLRAWARWLPQFNASGVPYLLDNFIRRAGRIIVTDEDLVVEMEAHPLDVVLELAGYLSDLDRVAWLGNRRVHYRTVT